MISSGRPYTSLVIKNLVQFDTSGVSYPSTMLLSSSLELSEGLRLWSLSQTEHEVTLINGSSSSSSILLFYVTFPQ